MFLINFCIFQLFEGMKAYRGVDGKIRLFRPDMNMRRMNLTARRCGLPTFDIEEGIKCLKRIVQIEQEWVPHTESASLYIRPTLIGIEPTLGVASSDAGNFSVCHRKPSNLVIYYSTILRNP